MISVTGAPIEPASLLDQFCRTHAGSGAIASFVGQVRGGDVLALELDHHPTFTPKVVRAIGEDAQERFALDGHRIVHRHGHVPAGAPIVFVAVAAQHRRAAFEAVDYIMDRLKLEAPFWKRELLADGHRWIEPRPTDAADHARWSTNGVR